MSDAQYVIDVAANMSGGAQTIAQTDALTKQLTTAGVTADNVHDAIAKLSNQLDAAAAASTAAASALSAGQSEYAKLERAALQAAKAEEKAALSGVISPEVAASAASAASAVNVYATHLKTLESEADKTSAAEKALEATLANAKKLHVEAAGATEEHAVSTRVLSRGLSELGGPLGTLGRDVLTPIRGFQALSQEIGGSQAVMAVAAIGAVALVAAIAAVTAAVIYGTAKIAAWAVGLADANRNAALTIEATEVLDPALEKLHGTIDGLTTQTGLTETALDGIAESLQKAHVAAKDMPAALKAAALAEAALGQGGAQKFIDQIGQGGKSVKQLSATVSAELGGVVAKKLLGLDAQSTQFHKNIASLFGGLNIDPALTGLQKLVGLFDENTAAGKAIKFLFESIFQPLIDNADKAATVVEAFALGFLIGLTKLYIYLKPTIKAISEFFGAHDPSLEDTLAAVTKAGEYVAPVIAGIAAVFVVVAVAVGVAVAAIVAIQLAIYAMIGAVVYAGVEIVSGIIGAWTAVTNYLSSINLGTIGNALIQGLIAGIEGAAGSLISSITGVVGGGIDAAKHLLGIHSPSKVFAEIGGNTVAGFTGGVDDAAPDAQSALENMVDPSSSSASAAPKSSKSTTPSASSGSPVTISGPFIFNGVQGAEDAEARFTEIVTRIWEGDAASIGGAPA